MNRTMEDGEWISDWSRGSRVSEPWDVDVLTIELDFV